MSIDSIISKNVFHIDQERNAKNEFNRSLEMKKNLLMMVISYCLGKSDLLLSLEVPQRNLLTNSK